MYLIAGSETPPVFEAVFGFPHFNADFRESVTDDEIIAERKPEAHCLVISKQKVIHKKVLICNAANFKSGVPMYVVS